MNRPNGEVQDPNDIDIDMSSSFSDDEESNRKSINDDASEIS